MMTELFKTTLALGLAAGAMGGVSAMATDLRAELPQSRRVDGKFQNVHPVDTRSLGKIPAIAREWLLHKHKLSEPEAGIIPVELINRFELSHSEGLSFYRLGHSTILLSMESQWWLIDPVFSERASPVQWAGPKRFHPSPIDIEALPYITGVVISHDHYDHLDKQAIKALHSRVGHFVVPLGVDRHLKDWGIEAEKIYALDWWQAVRIGNVELTATPAQHFSGRGISDGDETLWASWVLKGQRESVFYSGDGGYFDGFKAIGKALGPFDLTFIETGAYNQTWINVHMLPEQSVQAHIDVRGKYMVPVHNSTFDLSLHAWYEPLERVSVAAAANRVALITPVIGQRQTLIKPVFNAWWKGVIPAAEPRVEASVAERAG